MYLNKNIKFFIFRADNIVSRFPEYSVTFHGICNGPPGTEDLGACSQMAVFHKIHELNIAKVPGVEGLFHSVEVYKYPFKIDSRTDEEKIRDDAIYFIHKISLNQEEITEEIPLTDLINIMANAYVTLDDLKKILENDNWTVINREDGPVVLVPPISPFSSCSTISKSFDYDYSLNENQWNNESEALMNLDDDWENEPLAGFKYHNTINMSLSPNVVDSTPSIYSDDVSLDDLLTENRSTELASSSINESIFISSFSETKGSENSDTPKDSCMQVQTPSTCTDSKIAEGSTSFFSTQSLEDSKLKTLNNDYTASSLRVNTSMCSMFLEPSKMSEDVHIDDLSLISESNTLNSSVTDTFTSFNNNSPTHHNTNENTFDEPKYTSSPQISLLCKKNKITEQKADYLYSSCTNIDNEELMFCTNNKSKDVIQQKDDKFNDTCKFKKSLIIESEQR
jgi:hypothetical protein